MKLIHPLIRCLTMQFKFILHNIHLQRRDLKKLKIADANIIWQIDYIQADLVDPGKQRMNFKVLIQPTN